MTIALTLKQYLDDKQVDYDVTTHEPTSTSTRTAQASHVPGDCLAKGVVLSREGGFTLAVVPASCHVDLGALHNYLRGPVSIASEEEISALFPDCDVGAIPPMGDAYGIDEIIDSSLDDRKDIYFEAGDHKSLIHLKGTEFKDLHANAPHGHIAEHI